MFFLCYHFPFLPRNFQNNKEKKQKSRRWKVKGGLSLFLSQGGGYKVTWYIRGQTEGVKLLTKKPFAHSAVSSVIIVFWIVVACDAGVFWGAQANLTVAILDGKARRGLKRDKSDPKGEPYPSELLFARSEKPLHGRLGKWHGFVTCLKPV